MPNRDVTLTLEDAVLEVLGTLTGLDLHYSPELDRFQAITRALNRALRAVALEAEWSYFTSDENVSTSFLGQTKVDLSINVRPRIINDDCVRLVAEDGKVVRWCYYLPRDAIHKYASRRGLWVSVSRTQLTFSRPIGLGENGLSIIMPAMREPRMFRLPKDSGATRRILDQPIDFDYPDLVVAKAAQLIAETDPVMQPRVQTLEAQYKDLMYQLIERDGRITDSPYQNDFIIPIENDINGSSYNNFSHTHPHSDERWF